MVKALHSLDDVIENRRSDFIYGQICCEGDYNENKPSQGLSMISSLTINNINRMRFACFLFLMSMMVKNINKWS